MAVCGVDAEVEDMMVRVVVAVADAVVVAVRDRDAKLVEMKGRSNVRVKVEAMDFFSESSTGGLGPAGGGEGEEERWMRGSVGWEVPAVQCLLLYVYSCEMGVGEIDVVDFFEGYQ